MDFRISIDRIVRSSTPEQMPPVHEDGCGSRYTFYHATDQHNADRHPDDRVR